MVKRFLFCAVLCLTAAGVSFSGENTNVVETVTVSAVQSYTGKEFTYSRTLKERVRNHLVYEVAYPSPVTSAYPENNTVPAELYLPVGLKPGSMAPAVVCLHILNGDFALCRMMCSRLSEAGVVAMFFKQPFYGSRGGKDGRRTLLRSYETLISGFDQSTADARRAFDIVQNQSGVDPEKCGVSGISLGAIRAGALCAYEPRIKRAYLSLVAGDLKQVILTARETRDLRAFIQKLPETEQDQVWKCIMRQDPLNAVPQLQALARAGKLRMVRAENDQIMAPECSIKLFDAVGSPESQVCLKGMGHYSAMAGLAGIMDDLTSFFAEDLPAEWKPQVADNTLTPVVLLGGFLTDISALIAASPKKGCAHMAGVRVEFSVKGRSQKFDFNLVLGEDGCFKLSGVFPEVGSAGLGRGAFPWIIGGGKKVFCGTQSADPDLKLADMIGPDAMLRYRMAVGLAAGASLSPDLINNYAKAGIRNGGGRRILTLASLHKEAKGGAEIIFDESGRHPLKAVWDVGESKGSVEFTHWQINAASHSSLFEPDDGVERQDVLQQDVLQMFASAFQFLAEKAGEL